ncbi:MAG: IS630 family transposase [Holosporaceae bacterium]|nr:IS630 family transposase [Holosporaceae bacterium]
MKKEDYADVLFFDEARFGTHTKIGYGWFPKGERTPVKMKIGYKAFYVYGAVSAKTGSNYSASFPNVNTECMNDFLKRLSKHYQEKKIAIIMDGAGWHRSEDLETPENIDIFLLPPYSPELNPVERFWGYLKQNVMHNKLFESLDEIEESLQTFLNNLKDSTVAQLCNNNYLVI